MEKENASLFDATANTINQLRNLVSSISNDQYRSFNTILLDASIGQHVRHVIELFLELHQGYTTGIVNYDKRKRDKAIETDKEIALKALGEITINLAKANKSLQLIANYCEDGLETVVITTNYYRELAYNLEHTIHHMALIRIGLNATAKIEFPNNFGVANATVKFKQSCVQ
jgi:uncharacterized damage-inducible protein DinB